MICHFKILIIQQTYSLYYDILKFNEKIKIKNRYTMYLHNIFQLITYVLLKFIFIVMFILGFV